MTMKWVAVLGSRGQYEVSDIGLVRESKSRRIVKQYRSSGYRHVYLPLIGKRSAVHRLVYSSFVRRIPKGMQINHINSNRGDNHLDNLETVTPWQNAQHALGRTYRKISRFKLPKFDRSKLPSGSPLVTASQAMKLCGMTRQTFYRWANRLRLRPAVALPFIYAFYKPDIEQIAAFINGATLNNGNL